MAAAVRSPEELCTRLGLPATLAAAAGPAARDFPLLVPLGWLARIWPGDPADPLLLQVLPRAEECRPAEGFSLDPVAEVGAACAAGVLKKYHGRALLMTTPACAIHCRFCFRRHFPYDRLGAASSAWGPALAAIAADASIREVILSGGDPLMLDDAELAELARSLAAIGHVERLRVHTRLPIVVPQRVTDGLVSFLCGTRLTPIVVVHVNHPAEIDDQVAAALARLVEAGVPVLNQSVLLAGVNDRADVLEELCQRLVGLRVIPYYLHRLDRVAGAAHFEVTEAVGVRLIETLRERLPGYAVPRLVRETPGRACKERLA